MSTARQHRVRHALGEVTVPVDPRRIVALDELAGLAALGAGRPPAVVYASLGDATSAGILRAAGLDVRERRTLSLPAPDELRADAPDLVVGTGADGPAGRRHARLSAVAPTAVLGIEEDWRTVTRYAAAAVGAAAAGARQIDAVERRLAAARTDLRRHGRDRLALLGYTTEPFTMSPHTPSSTLIADAGFTRPDTQQAPGRRWSVPVDLDRLAEHDADVIVLPDGAGAPVGRITSHPRFADLGGRVVRTSARQWFGNSAFSFWVIARDLQALAAGGTGACREEDLGAAWAQFLAATRPAAEDAR